MKLFVHINQKIIPNKSEPQKKTLQIIGKLGRPGQLPQDTKLLLRTTKTKQFASAREAKKPKRKLESELILVVCPFFWKICKSQIGSFLQVRLKMKRYLKFHHRSGTVCHFLSRGVKTRPWDAYRDDISRPISSRHAAVVHHHKARKVRRGPEHPEAKQRFPWKESTTTKKTHIVYLHLPSKSTIHKKVNIPFVPWIHCKVTGKASKIFVGKLVRNYLIYSNLPVENMKQH